MKNTTVINFVIDQPSLRLIQDHCDRQEIPLTKWIRDAMRVQLISLLGSRVNKDIMMSDILPRLKPGRPRKAKPDQEEELEPSMNLYAPMSPDDDIR